MMAAIEFEPEEMIGWRLLRPQKTAPVAMATVPTNRLPIAPEPPVRLLFDCSFWEQGPMPFLA